MPQLINQCQTPQRRIKRRRRGEEKSVTGGDAETEDGSEWAAKMSDAKSVSAMEAPEGKLIKKVSVSCNRLHLKGDGAAVLFTHTHTHFPNSSVPSACPVFLLTFQVFFCSFRVPSRRSWSRSGDGVRQV